MAVLVRNLIILFILTTVFNCTGNTIKTVKHSEQSRVKLPIQIKLPNNEWHLAVNKGPDQFIYKRKPIKDSKGRSIMPAIMIYSEDAKKYNQDVSMFWIDKMKPFTIKGIKANKVLKWHQKDYPLTMKNAIFVEGSYVDQGMAHIMYMIYIIDKHNKGIQIYMDMTNELVEKYGKEFSDAIKSIKEL